ncbi:MAG: HNH endonuclease, partial [Alphaproteobacteria bacterium]|nr:HNH endonuclease [Alphaproteobacteria bacterium]
VIFKKYSLVNSGDNGIWLCKNHHGLFDKNYFCFDGETGKVLLYFKDTQDAIEFANDLKEDFSLPNIILTSATKSFIIQRQLCFSA